MNSTTGRRPTLATLAADLGVARSTVSNAYNRPDQLSDELRTRILDRARELSYAGPHPAARRLNNRTLTTVGVIFSEQFTYPFVDAAAREFLAGLGTVAEAQQLSVLLIPAPVRGSVARPAIENAVVDALVVYSMPNDDDALIAALGRHVPTVVVDQPRVAGPVFVGVDDRGGAAAAMGHVLDAGHTDVAVVAYRLERDGATGWADEQRQAGAIYANARARLQGYRDAVEARGGEWVSVRVLERPEHSYQDGLAAGRQLLTAKDRPTAIVTFSDVLAAGVIDAARELGLQVPADVSVVGFDDAEIAAQYGLTTVRQPLKAKGELVGRLLVDAWEQGGLEGDTVLPVELIVRSSVGPPS